MEQTKARPVRRCTALRIAGFAVGALLLIGTPGCDGESQTKLDPQQERNIRPGLREEGTPRSEEN